MGSTPHGVLPLVTVVFFYGTDLTPFGLAVMIKVYFNNAGMSGSADAVEYPNADGYGIKDADWIIIKAGMEVIAVIASSAIQRIEGDVGERKAHYRPQPVAAAAVDTQNGYGISPFAKPK